MTSSNTFQSNIGLFQNGGHGEDIIKACLKLFNMYYSNNESIFCFSAFLFFSLPTDRPTFMRERAIGNKTVYGDGLIYVYIFGELEIFPTCLSFIFLVLGYD